MPNYDLKCTQCDYQYEKFFTIKEFKKTKKICPMCGNKAEVTFTTAPAVHNHYPPWDARHRRGMGSQGFNPEKDKQFEGYQK
jgi:putative FmdB family regulatory protein